MNKEFEIEFGDLWSKDSEFVLVKSDSSNYLIRNIKTGSFVIIEDINKWKKVVHQMKKAGNKIYKSMEDLPLPSREPYHKSLDDFIDWAKSKGYKEPN